MPQRTEIEFAQRWLVLGAVLLVPLVRWRTFNDVFSLPKAVLIAAFAIAIVAVAVPLLPVAIRRRQRPSAFASAVGAWSVGVVVSALASGQLLLAVLGPYRRWNGAALYIAVGVLGLTAAFRLRRTDVETLLRLLVGTAVVIAVYALLQRSSIIDKNLTTEGALRIVGTLGNPNFVAGYMAIALPGAVREVVAARSTGTRVAWAGAGTMLAVVAVLSQSLQGIVAGAAGVAAGAVIWLWSSHRSVARGVLGLSAVGAAATAVGLAGVGPLGFLAAERTFELRTYYWAAALEMLQSSPITGVGVGRYIAHFRAARSLEAAQTLPSTIEVDGAHNVPLDMFATGGLLTGLAYVAVIVVVAALLVRATVRANAGDSLLLAAIGGGWVAYLVQAAVSLDTPSLLLVGWVIAGSVVAVSRSLLAPTEDDAATTRANRKRKRAKGRRRTTQALGLSLPPVPRGRALTVAVATVGVVLVAPFRLYAAERDAQLARSALLQQRGGPAVTRANAAVDRIGFLAEYWNLLGRAHTGLGDPSSAVAAYSRGVAADPGLVEARVSLAREAAKAGDYDRALASWAEVVALDPRQAEWYVRAGTLALDVVGAEEAEAWGLDAIDADPESAEAWVLLGRARHALGDLQGAIEALERGLELGADSTTARNLLDEMSG